MELSRETKQDLEDTFGHICPELVCTNTSIRSFFPSNATIMLCAWSPYNGGGRVMLNKKKQYVHVGDIIAIDRLWVDDVETSLRLEVKPFTDLGHLSLTATEQKGPIPPGGQVVEIIDGGNDQDPEIRRPADDVYLKPGDSVRFHGYRVRMFDDMRIYDA